MHGKQKRCLQRSRNAKLLKRSRQMGHLESGDASSAAIRWGRADVEAEDAGGDKDEEDVAAVEDLLAFFLLLPLSRLFCSSSSSSAAPRPAAPAAALSRRRTRSFIRVGAIT